MLTLSFDLEVISGKMRFRWPLVCYLLSIMEQRSSNNAPAVDILLRWEISFAIRTHWDVRGYSIPYLQLS